MHLYVCVYIYLFIYLFFCLHMILIWKWRVEHSENERYIGMNWYVLESM